MPSNDPSAAAPQSGGAHSKTFELYREFRTDPSGGREPLFAHLSTLVHGWAAAQRGVLNADDRLDLAQETLARVYAQFDDYDPAQRLRAWVFGIAYRVRLEKFREVCRRRRHGTDEPLASVPAKGAPPSAEARRTDVVARTAAFVERRLRDERERRLFAAILEGRTRDAIARELGLKQNTVNAAVKRMRDRIGAAGLDALLKEP